MQKFLKKNGFYILVGLCVVCIGAMIIVSVSANNRLSEMKKPTPTPTSAITEPTHPVVKPTEKPKPSEKPTDPADTVPTSFVLPVAEATIGQDYSADTFVFSETLNQWQVHNGIDFVTVEPSDVRSIADGAVTSVITDDILCGGTVVITHSGGITSTYKSLGSKIPVKVGDKVKAGDKIGMTSMSAYNEFKEGNHVHFEMAKDGKTVDPNEFLVGLK